jgi:hypothetical protein
MVNRVAARALDVDGGSIGAPVPIEIAADGRDGTARRRRPGQGRMPVQHRDGECRDHPGADGPKRGLAHRL